MRFLFSTGSLWTYSIERCFAFAAEAGFDGLEIVVDHRWETRHPDYLKRLSDQHGLPVLAIHSPFMPELPGWPGEQPLRIKASVRLAEQLEAKVVVHHLPSRIGFAYIQVHGSRVVIPLPYRPESSYRRWIEDDYETYQKSTSVRLSIENMPAYRKFRRRWNYSHWNTPTEMKRFPNITMDTTHLATWNLDPLKFYALHKDRIAHIHLSNFDGREHQALDQGILRLDRLLVALVSDHYEGLITVELEPDALQAGSSDEKVLGEVKAAIDFCRQWT